MARLAAELTMERETRVRLGSVPQRLLDTALSELSWKISADEFLLHATGEHYFYYRRGEGITVERGPGADLSEESLWLNGSVYAAIASLNGLLPIHASAVAVNGLVYAFTGSAGAGKSTLIAGLGNEGIPMFCDDTLVLDLSDPERILCLPGHKRLKLAPDSLEMIGAVRGEKVSLDVDKYYSASAAGNVQTALPIAELIFLEVASEPSIVPMAGIERYTRMQDEHYTSQLFASAQRFDRAGYFSHLARLANALRMSRFARPLDKCLFVEGVKLIADYVSAQRIPDET